MAVFLLVCGYILAYMGLFWAGWKALRADGPNWRRLRWGIWLVLGVAVFYSCSAPACVYLPVVPGGAGIRRTLLGSDAAGRLYWTEERHEVAFAWGPRWYLAIGGHLVDGGFEFVPPLRFAAPKPGVTDLVRSDGRRTRFPPPYIGARRLHLRRFLVDEDGGLVAWSFDELFRLDPGDAAWRRVAALERTDPDAVARLPGNRLLELRENEAVATRSRGQERGVVFIERDWLGVEIRRQELVVVEEHPDMPPGGMGRGLGVQPVPGGVLLFVTWGGSRAVGEGRIYHVSSDYKQSEVRGGFEFDEQGPASALAASPDGNLFTNGHAIFRVSGERLQDLDHGLQGCTWVGGRLAGVKPYPFFASLILNRSVPFNAYLARASTAQADLRDDFVLRHAREALRPSRWVLGGVDESGREDEIVEKEIR